MTDDEKCPECGRRKARNAFDASAGDCPKWWAIRDAEAAADCDQYRRKNWHSIAEVLNKPARVGNTVFRAGISTAAVIEAAQRLYEADPIPAHTSDPDAS
jgi:hypothetical protein